MADKLQFNQQAQEPQAAAAAPAAKEQASSTAPAQETGAANSPTFVTKEEFERAMADLRNSNRRSTKDVVTDVIRKELSRLQGAGIQATPEQVERLVQQQPQELPAAPSAPPAVQQAEGSEQQVHPEILKAQTKIDQAGLKLDDSPEWELIDQATDDPVVFQASVDRAIAALLEKKGRVGSPARMAAPASKGTPMTNPIANVTDTDALWKMAVGK